MHTPIRHAEPPFRFLRRLLLFLDGVSIQGCRGGAGRDTRLIRFWTHWDGVEAESDRSASEKGRIRLNETHEVRWVLARRADAASISEYTSESST